MSAGLNRFKVEAALFSAGRPVEISELENSTDLGRRAVKKALAALAEHHETREGSLVLLEVKDRWVLQVRAEYAEYTRKLAQPTIARYLLRTAALIAYHQPLLQSELVNIGGARIYDHVKELIELGLVRASREGRSYKLSTTEEFPTAFGLRGTTNDELKRELQQRLEQSKIVSTAASSSK